MRAFLRRMTTGAAMLLALVALLDQLGRHPSERDWHGKILGVPYDFRAPTLERVRASFWNPNDERILTPQVFGIGWSLNLYQVVRRAGLLIA